MDEKQNKTLEKLARAVEASYNSAGKMFWRGFLYGLGRGIGNLVGFLLLLAVLYYLFKITGLDETFHRLFEQFSNITGGLTR
ncbi:MAG: hypothetical protein A3K06_03810 [Candidatus Doudnabacteria bacterium RIFCSPHIGHO2_01_52_17]|uniref:Uncharacterized protein n=1 Tax=Candidatus Doudnabacteria bacterium RIFCSPHIGHO2_01_52_17 TaxID=1817820 RepID=A0A1F5NE27_9BACT|nr:MAG: hypothetical protein UY73_C0039G0004 [Parcubacteria group bacterium GW2011_GWA2_52_8]OGE75792.1 MAG: hypothetical protein A3K06_03810 [Candidatus Doudnabacteria bacterium RIFCSPHIGHO2_01_52_17]